MQVHVANKIHKQRQLDEPEAAQAWVDGGLDISKKHCLEAAKNQIWGGPGRHGLA